MKYTEEQRAILALCRKYKGVNCIFHKNFNGFAILDNGDDKWFVPLQDVEKWLNEHATLKQVGRPKGSIKPSRKVRKFVSLSADQWSKVEGIRNQQGLKYASHAIGHCIDFFADYCLNKEVSND